MPGELVAKEGSDTKGGYYTPIAGELGQGFQARPIFYGMVLANQLAGTQSKEVALTANAVNATAYAGEKDGQLRIAIFNKDDAHDLRLSLRMPPDFHRANVWRLTAPALDSTSGVTLAGSEISAKSTWSPTQVETLPTKNDGLVIELPKASAALVFLDG